MKLSLTAPAVFLLACLCTITYSTEAIILDSNVTAAVTASDYSAVRRFVDLQIFQLP